MKKFENFVKDNYEPHDFWNFLKDKCNACFKLNKNRPNPKGNAESCQIKLCKKHKKDFVGLMNMMKKYKLPPLTTKEANGQS